MRQVSEKLACQRSVSEMEASKCPKCGDEPHYIEQMEKWYCYGCNSYLEEGSPEHTEVQPEAKTAEVGPAKPNPSPVEPEPLDHGDRVVTCPRCGAELEEIKDGKMFCYICEEYADEVGAPATSTNEPQSLLDSAVASLCSQSAQAQPEPSAVAAPSATPETAKAPEPREMTCSACGQPLKWIERYQRHYCYGCRKYAPKEQGQKPKAEVAPSPAPLSRRCPDCGGELKFIEKYNEHYCYTCRKYPFHKKSERGKPETTPAVPSQGPACAKCGEPLKYIERYQRHYCFKCRAYAPKEVGGPAQGQKNCPACGHEMRFIKEYNEWYCYTCKRYPLRPTKPLLLV